MTLSKVKSALLKAFVDGQFFDDKAVQYENRAFTQPASGEWAAVHFLPAPTTVATLGPAGLDEAAGILQVDLNYPIGTGDGKAREKVEAFRAIFKAGHRVFFQDAEVIIRSCSAGPGREINSNYRVSVSIVFYSHINR